MSDDHVILSEREKQLIEMTSARTAVIVVDKILAATLNEDFVDKIFDIWGGKIDKTIGRGLRRLGFYMVIAVIGIAAVKFGLTEKILSFLGLKP